jgi:hypothetical protein
MVRRPPARHGVLAASRATVRLPRPSASPSARPRCSWQTVSGSAAATSANWQRPGTSSVVRPRPGRPEAAAGQFLFQQASQVTSARQSGAPPVTFLPARLKRTCCRRTAAAGRLGSQARAGRARFPAPSGCSRRRPGRSRRTVSSVTSHASLSTARCWRTALWFSRTKAVSSATITAAGASAS